jgi:hypothetical protein
MIPLGASSPSSSMEPSRDFPFREQSPLTTTRLPPPQLPPLPVGKSETVSAMPPAPDRLTQRSSYCLNGSLCPADRFSPFHPFKSPRHSKI